MRRMLLLAPFATSAWLAAISCSAPPPAPVRHASQPPAPPVSVEQPLPVPVWRPVPKALGGQSLAPRAAGEDGGWILGGLRVALRSELPSVAQDVAESPLIGGERLPQAWGGGFLFWSNNAIYSSKTFLSELRPIMGARGRIASVSFGPGFALIRQSDGDRWAWDPVAGKRTRIDPPGLVDIAASADGRVAAVLEGARLLTSIDAGKTWRDGTARAQPWPSTLLADQDGVWIGVGVAGALRLEKDGTLTDFSAIPKPSEPVKDARWTPNESPLERAVRKGVVFDNATAVVEVSGAVARIDVRTGALIDTTRRVLPPDMECECLRLGPEVLIACRNQQSSVVASLRPGADPVVEMTFARRAVFASAGANLLVDGPCDGAEKTPGIVCVRRGGLWSQLDASDAFDRGDAGPDKSGEHRWEVSRWIPDEVQGAIGIVVRPKFGFLHARYHAFLECADGCPARHVDGLARASSDDVIDRTWVVTGEGTLRGWTRDGAVTVAFDGTVRPSAYRFPSVRGVGNRGLAWDRDGRVWQSEDRGDSWKEVLGPPSNNGSHDPMACSDVGCQLGPWIRVGWTPDAPVPTPPPARVRTPALIRAPQLPRLLCTGTGEARSAVRSADENPTVSQDTGLGARLILRTQGETRYFRSSHGLGPIHPIVGMDATAFGMTAILHAKTPRVVDGPLGPTPERQDVLENTYTWWYAEPFEPSAQIKTSSLRLRQMAEAAGPMRPALLTLSEDSDKPAVPVLGIAPGKSGGMLLGMEGSLWTWVRPAQAQPISILAFGPEITEPGEVVSAAATADDRVTMLAVTTDGSSKAIELEKGKARILFFLPPPPKPSLYPGNADALAVHPKAGLAVIRTPSGSEPATREDPAWLLRSNDAPVALAPWSTLATAEAPECASDTEGYRAILQMPKAWLDVRNASAPVAESRGMLAIVRWSPTRVCLEAVIAAADTIEVRSTQVPTNYVVKFTDKPAAARVGITLGAEYRSGQSCTLQRP
jgi:hypothetical protein